MSKQFLICSIWFIFLEVHSISKAQLDLLNNRPSLRIYLRTATPITESSKYQLSVLFEIRTLLQSDWPKMRQLNLLNNCPPFLKKGGGQLLSRSAQLNGESRLPFVGLRFGKADMGRSRADSSSPQLIRRSYRPDSTGTERPEYKSCTGRSSRTIRGSIHPF